VGEERTGSTLHRKAKNHDWGDLSEGKGVGNKEVQAQLLVDHKIRQKKGVWRRKRRKCGPTEKKGRSLRAKATGGKMGQDMGGKSGPSRDRATEKFDSPGFRGGKKVATTASGDEGGQMRGGEESASINSWRKTSLPQLTAHTGKLKTRDENLIGVEQ